MTNEPLLLKHFVRDTLGCRCPEEVFQRIEISNLSTAASNSPHSLRINIGNRLLVYLVPHMSIPPDQTTIANLLERGIQDRDRNGFNRLRLAIGCDAPESFPTDGHAWLTSLFPGDNKVHLHLMPTSLIPAQFAYRPSTSATDR